jgi:hypothetical protein
LHQPWNIWECFYTCGETWGFVSHYRLLYVCKVRVTLPWRELAFDQGYFLGVLSDWIELLNCDKTLFSCMEVHLWVFGFSYNCLLSWRGTWGGTNWFQVTLHYWVLSRKTWSMFHFFRRQPPGPLSAKR